MARIRADYVFGTTSAAIDADDTTLSSAGLADLPAVTAPDVAAVTLHDGTNYEIVHVTAHTAAATTATILRGQEGSTAQAWASGADWNHGATADDFTDEADSTASPYTGETSLVDYTPTGTVVNVDTSTGHQAFPTAVTLRNGKHVTIYRTAGQHAWGVGGTSARRVSTDDGATWSAAATALSSATDDSLVTFCQRRDGSLVGLVVVRPDATTTNWTSAAVTSTDEGVTWSAYSTVDVGYDTMSYPSHIIELPNGDLLGAFYGENSGSGADYAVCGVSTDGGATWARRSVIAQDSDNWQEPTYVLMPDGEILCFLRFQNSTNTVLRIYLARSVDNGVTWSTPTQILSDAGGMPAAHLSRNGLLVLAYRRTNASDACGWATSTDRGNTWTTRGNFESTNTRYVYADWLDLSDGDLGLVYALENPPNGTVADVHFMRFPRKLAETVPLNKLDTSGGGEGYVVTLTSGTPGWAPAAGGGGGGAGRATLLKETVLASSAATISFTSSDIPSAGYKHLLLEVVGRVTASVTADSITVSINSDTTDANYIRQQLVGTASTASAQAADGVAGSRFIGALPGASAAAGAAGSIEAQVFEYSGTTWHKHIRSLAIATGTPALYYYMVRRKNTAAVTSIDLAPLSGGNQFATGTTARLYGLT